MKNSDFLINFMEVKRNYFSISLLLILILFLSCKSSGNGVPEEPAINPKMVSSVPIDGEKIFPLIS